LAAKQPRLKYSGGLQSVVSKAGGLEMADQGRQQLAAWDELDQRIIDK